MSAPDLPMPLPAGAIAGDWFVGTGHPDDVSRVLTWSRLDAAGAVVAVEGAQYGGRGRARYRAVPRRG